VTHEYDLAVVGSGPGGHRAAIQAAKLRRRVAVVERPATMGGVSVNSGTIPSKTLREAILYLTGLEQRDIYGQAFRVKADLTYDDLRRRMEQVVDTERNVVRDQLQRNHVTVVEGHGRFAGPHELRVSAPEGERRITAERFVVATGSRPTRPDGVAFNDRTILDSDGILRLEAIPESVVVVGGGVIGVEYASMFTALGSRVTIVDRRPEILPFCDREVVEALSFYLRDRRLTLRLGEKVVAVEEHGDATVTRLASGKRIAADVVLYSAGRRGALDGLGLEHAGVTATDKGLIPVSGTYRTQAEHIWAVGDVIGFPSLAASSAEQGRIAALDACGHAPDPVDTRLMPFGIYAIPEISFVGRTESQLTDAAIPYEVGVARYRELARGQIMGESSGMLKLMVHAEDRTILGVHAFGVGATELVHIGQTAMALGGTVDYLVEAVFNYPTLAEAYKVAALDAANRLAGLEEALSA
jgi:NAD(P) transhydrogenase